MTHTINSASTVAVATDYFWQPIDTCPNGVKVQLLGKGGVNVSALEKRSPISLPGGSKELPPHLMRKPQ